MFSSKLYWQQKKTEVEPSVLSFYYKSIYAFLSQNLHFLSSYI